MAYIVPLYFGFQGDDEQVTLYFYSAKKGKKVELISTNPHVSFEMDCKHDLVYGKMPAITALLKPF